MERPQVGLPLEQPIITQLFCKILDKRFKAPKQTREETLGKTTMPSLRTILTKKLAQL
jgi:hypothetical protein